MNTHFDEIEAEKKELNIMLDIGTTFKIPLKKLFGKTINQTFRIRYPKLGTLDFISAQQIHFIVDDEFMQKHPIEFAKQATGTNIDVCANIIAVSILNDYWKIIQFKKLLATYLKTFVTPEELFKCAKFLTTLLDNQSYNQLYAIIRKKDLETEEDKGTRTGLQSPYGYRGSVMEKFGWTWHELHWGPSWAIIERMLIDAPGYLPAGKSSEGKGKAAEGTTVIQGSFNDIIAHMKTMQR